MTNQSLIASGALACAALAVQVGCSTGPKGNKDRPLSEIPLERVESAREWRYARRLSPGDAVDVGVVPPRGVLRLAALGDGKAAETGSLNIIVEDRPIQRLAVDGSGFWSHAVYDLSAQADGEARCRLEVAGPMPIWISPGELFSFQPPRQPNILVVLIDTLRQDRLSSQGYGRATTPAIDAFARQALTFADLYPQSSWTRASCASLFTSTYPGVHGAIGRSDVMRDGLPSLFETLGSAGYETQAFVGNPNILPEWGFGDDFDRFVSFVDQSTISPDKRGLVSRGSRDDFVIDWVLQAMRHAWGRPWTFYVHLMAPHAPYDPPPAFRARFQRSSDEGSGRDDDGDRYDAEIAFVDGQFGRLIAALKAMRLYDDTMVLLLSDHGEAFAEHGFTEHGNTLYEEETRIPLLVKLPGQRSAGRIRHGLIEVVDIAPTILDILKLPANPRFQGRSALPLIEQGSWPLNIGYASLQLDGRSSQSARTGSFKYIRDATTKHEAWFDLRADPLETISLPTRPATAPALDAHASQMALRGMPGLHLLVVQPPESRQAIVCTVRSPDLSTFDIHPAPDRAGVTMGDGSLVLEIGGQSVRPGETTTSHRTHLVVPLPPTTQVEIDIEVDGRDIAVENVHLGEAARHRALDGSAVALSEVLASGSFEPQVPEAHFGVHVWYVERTKQVADEDLDDEVRQSLEHLGYIQ